MLQFLAFKCFEFYNFWIDWTPLHYAAYYDHDDIVDLLLAHGANREAQGYKKITPFSCSVFNRSYKSLRLFMQYGIEFNQYITNNMTLAYYACKEGDIDLLRYLIYNGADINSLSRGGRAPLHAAVLDYHQEMVTLLLSNGADINARDHQGLSALELSIQTQNPEFIQFFISKGANKMLSPAIKQFLGKHQINPDILELLQKNKMI